MSFFCVVFGCVVVLFYKKMLFAWICFELMLYGTMSISCKTQKPEVMYFYMILSVLGSFFFIYGVFFSSKMLLILGLLMKLGLFPSFFLLVPVMLRSCWLVIWLILVLKKLPLLYLIVLFGLKIQVFLFYLIVLFCFCIYSKYNKMKFLMIWSSKLNTCLMMFFLQESLLLGCLMIFLYVLLFSSFCFFFYEKKKTKGLTVLVNFAGFPPMLFFYFKLNFFFNMFSNYSFFVVFGVSVLLFFFLVVYVYYFLVFMKHKNFGSFLKKNHLLLVLFSVFCLL